MAEDAGLVLRLGTTRLLLLVLNELLQVRRSQSLNVVDDDVVGISGLVMQYDLLDQANRVRGIYLLLLYAIAKVVRALLEKKFTGSRSCFLLLYFDGFSISCFAVLTLLAAVTVSRPLSGHISSLLLMLLTTRGLLLSAIRRSKCGSRIQSRLLKNGSLTHAALLDISLKAQIGALSASLGCWGTGHCVCSCSIAS